VRPRPAFKPVSATGLIRFLRERQWSVSLQKTALSRLIVFELTCGCVRIRCKIGEAEAAVFADSDENFCKEFLEFATHLYATKSTNQEMTNLLKT